MKVTQEQIQQIDSKITKLGIKYWDLRIEMIDHIVSDIEENATTTNFNEELKKSLTKLGWNKGLFDINKAGLKRINIKYRKQFSREIISFIKNFKNILLIIVFCVVQYLLSKSLNFKTFNRLNKLLFLLPTIVYFVFSIKIWLKKYGKSANLLYGIFYLTFPFFLFNIFPQFLRDFPEEELILMWRILIPIHLITSYSGYIICKKAISRVEAMKKELAL